MPRGCGLSQREVTAQLAHIAINIVDFKNDSNSWSDAFELSYSKLPEYGGKILIPTAITIDRSINLRTLGDKKVLIEGNSITQNMLDTFTSRIIKNGNFDGVVLNGGSSMRNIMVTRASGVVDTGDGIWIAGLDAD